MKKIFDKKWLVTLMMGAAMFGACTDDALVETPEVMQEESKDTYVATITAKLPRTAVGSRLAYENGTYEGKNAILTKWDADDKVVINFFPSDKSKAHVFTLKSGAGTNEATFENAAMPNYNSARWIMYYPGDKILSEKDFLAHSYLGQVQKGNDNLGHLSDYHTIRYDRHYTEPTTFKDEIIDFSGDGFEESMCVKFNLSGFTSEIIPSKLELMYQNESGSFENIFYTHNYIDSYFVDEDMTYSPNRTTIARMSLNLEDFTATKQITAYMMLSNATMKVKSGGKFRVYVTTTNGKYYGDVVIDKDVDLEGGHLYSITYNKTWTKADNIDAFNNPTSGVVVLQEAQNGQGTDIIIMGDGFDKDCFGNDGAYKNAITNAYNDFFSVEPYASLKEYFNVYYVNAVSEDNHDAKPSGANGATNGTANTIFHTTFTSGSTSINGNNDMALEYAMQAIRTKGGKGGAKVTDEDEVYRRAHTSLMIVQVNVKAHAGTCHGIITNASNYGSSYSVAYTALGTSDNGRKWTTIHEAGGHGFGKLADEYEQYTFTQFDVASWTNLEKYHSWGYDRNIDEYWNPKSDKIKNIEIAWGDYAQDTWPITSADNVYWAKLLSNDYAYKNALNENNQEGLGVYEGGYTFNNFYCRPTDNSVMRSQFNENGHFFNAISRWAIWYRVMMLSGVGKYQDFESSLNDFIAFDKDKVIPKNVEPSTRGVLDVEEVKPLAPPVMKMGQWINGRLIVEE